MIRRILRWLWPAIPYTTPRELLRRLSGLAPSAEYVDLQDAGVLWIAHHAYVDGWDAKMRDYHPRT